MSPAPAILKAFLDQEGRLTGLPSRRRKQLAAFLYLAGQLPEGQIWKEKEINELLDSLCTFHDPATLRRELFDHGLLERERDGSSYRRADHLPLPEEFEQRWL